MTFLLGNIMTFLCEIILMTCYMYDILTIVEHYNDTLMGDHYYDLPVGLPSDSMTVPT